MENFRNVLKKRLTLLGAFNLLAVTFILLTGVYSNRMSNNNEHITEMIHGFQVGIFFGLQIIMVIQIVKYSRALKAEDKLKKLYIEENDERRKLIEDKIGGVGLNLILGAFMTATIIAGFFNQIVFITLLGVLAFAAFVKGFLKVYYKSKF